MPISSRQELAAYVLRRLGEDAIKVNVTVEQLSDRIDDALQFFQEFHFDGIERIYMKHVLTDDDITNKTVPLDNPGVVSIISLVSVPRAQFNIFDIRYQVMLNDFYNFNNVSMIHYQIARQHLALLEFLFDVKPTIRFNRNMDFLSVDIDWTTAKAGDMLVFECDAILDPDDFPKLYNDRWLKDYLTAIVKRQWAENLTKFNNVQLPGGYTLNGQQMLEQALEEMAALREEVETRYQVPPSFILG